MRTRQGKRHTPLASCCVLLIGTQHIACRKECYRSILKTVLFAQDSSMGLQCLVSPRMARTQYCYQLPQQALN